MYLYCSLVLLGDERGEESCDYSLCAFLSQHAFLCFCLSFHQYCAVVC
jgi:hypothetical protein